MNEKLEKIHSHYGLERQKLKLIEECSELIKELAKNNGENIINEMADVEVVMRGILQNNKGFQEKFDEQMEFKINRQLERMENENM